MRFAFIAAEKARHSVTRLCRCLRVTPSGFYAWTKRALSARAQRDVVLRTKLRAFHAASGHRYGRPNLWKDLQEDGEAVSEKRVARLMREEGIRGKVRRRFKNTTMSDHADPIAPNVLDRDFTAAGPNQRWVGDTSEFIVGEHGKLYLAAILDLYSRFIVGRVLPELQRREDGLVRLYRGVLQPAAPALDARQDQSGRLRTTRDRGVVLTVGRSAATAPQQHKMTGTPPSARRLSSIIGGDLLNERETQPT